MSRSTLLLSLIVLLGLMLADGACAIAGTPPSSWAGQQGVSVSHQVAVACVVAATGSIETGV